MKFSLPKRDRVFSRPPWPLQNRLSTTSGAEKLGSVEGVKNTVEGTVTLQFVGKKKERAPYACFINKNFFYYVKKKENKGPNMVFTPQAVQLDGCEVRLVEEGSSLPSARVHLRRQFVFSIF